MQLAFQCPTCQQPVRSNLAEADARLKCGGCHWSRIVSPADVANDRPGRCLVCGCGDLWRQKDFPQGLGLLFVGLGALLSTIAWAYTRPILAIGILMGFALADLLLYTFMKDVLVCYRCRARHRNANLDEEHPRFNLETAERYRQEALRLENSAKSKG